MDRQDWDVVYLIGMIAIAVITGLNIAATYATFGQIVVIILACLGAGSKFHEVTRS